MSLEKLTQLRLKRLKPSSVWVIVGKRPTWMEDTPNTVFIERIDRQMDFRALVGLDVDVIAIGDVPRLLEDVLKQIEGVGCRNVFIACNQGVIGLSPEHEQTLIEARRLMCS